MAKHGGQLGGTWVAEAPGGVAAMVLISPAASDHRLCAREAQLPSKHHHRGVCSFLGAGIVAAARYQHRTHSKDFRVWHTQWVPWSVPSTQTYHSCAVLVPWSDRTSPIVATVHFSTFCNSKRPIYSCNYPNASIIHQLAGAWSYAYLRATYGVAPTGQP